MKSSLLTLLALAAASYAAPVADTKSNDYPTLLVEIRALAKHRDI
jgi:hypothetical protein